MKSKSKTNSNSKTQSKLAAGKAASVKAERLAPPLAPATSPGDKAAARMKILRHLRQELELLSKSSVPGVADAAAEIGRSLAEIRCSLPVRNAVPDSERDTGAMNLCLAGLALGLEWFANEAATVEARERLLLLYGRRLSGPICELLEDGKWGVHSRPVMAWLPAETRKELITAARNSGFDAMDLVRGFVGRGLDALRSGRCKATRARLAEASRRPLAAPRSGASQAKKPRAVGAAAV